MMHSTVSYTEEFDRLQSRMTPKAKAAVAKHLDIVTGDANLGFGEGWNQPVFAAAIAPFFR